MKIAGARHWTSVASGSFHKFPISLKARTMEVVCVYHLVNVLKLKKYDYINCMYSLSPQFSLSVHGSLDVSISRRKCKGQACTAACFQLLTLSAIFLKIYILKKNIIALPSVTSLKKSNKEKHRH